MSGLKPPLTIAQLIKEAGAFCLSESKSLNKALYGVTDGKAVGTHIEHKFKEHLDRKYSVVMGSSASGIDLPSDDILTDIKVTSIRQPQSSCPFKNAMQKIFGLGYNLLVFVYDKSDHPKTRTAHLRFVPCAFISKERTADYSIRYRLREMLKDGADEPDIIAYLTDRNIPADEITLSRIAKAVLTTAPEQGYLTISNALQWRLQYQRIVDLDEEVSGIINIIKKPQSS